MIELKQVSYSYLGETRGNLKKIDLSIKKGECVLLCGRSGCGKTTITRLVNGLIPNFFDGELTGNIVVDIIGEAIDIHKLYTGKERESRIRFLLNKVGLNGSNKGTK